MAIERTFSIIKPDAVKANHIGGVVQIFEEGGLRVIGQKMILMSREQAEGFYAVHRERPFYKDLVGFMTSGPCVVQVLEGESAVTRNRDLMGATDSKKAADGTVRKKFGTDIERNAVHGSDSADNAKTEIAFFFAESELLSTTRR